MAIFSWLTFVCWFILMIFWIISAFRAKKRVGGRGWWWWRQLGIRAALLIIILILIHIGVIGVGASDFFYQHAAMTFVSILLGTIGVILCFAGVAFAIWARVHLGRNWGVPMTLQEGHQLVTSGPYKFVRHPIYTGFFLAALGSVFADGGVWLIILVFFGIYFTYSAKVEEKIMTEQFPNEYPAYIKRTKMLIPFVL